MLRATREHAAAAMLITLAAVAFSAPIWQSRGVPKGDDFFLHLTLADGVAQGLADGQVYPRWLDRGNHRYGIPALIGYPPLSAYAVGVTRLVTGDLMSASRLVIFLVNILAGLSFFVLARRFASPPFAGLGAALYVLMPYHFVTIYQRYSLAEFFCFIWMPLVLAFGLDLCDEPRPRSWILFCVSIAGLVLSHVAIAYLVVVAFGPVLLLRSRPLRRPRRALAMLLAGLAAMALIGVYVIPLLWSRHLIHWQAQYASTTAGFAFSRGRGLRGVLYDEVLATQVACCIPLVVAASRSARSHIAAWAGAVVVVVVLQLELTSYIWNHVPGFSFVLYPARLLALLSVLAPLALTWAFARRARLWAVGLLGCCAALWVSFSSVQDVKFVSLDGPGRPFSTRAPDLWNQEHVPATVPGFRDRAAMQRPVEAGAGADAVVLSWTSHSRRIRVDVRDKTADVKVRTFYFPGWEATVNGRPTRIGPDPESGVIELRLDRGVNDVRLEFRDTPDRVTGWWVSIATVCAFGLAAVFAAIRRRRSSATPP